MGRAKDVAWQQSTGLACVRPLVKKKKKTKWYGRKSEKML